MDRKEYDRQYRLKNKEKIRAYYQNKRAHHIERSKRYVAVNKEKIRQYSKQYYEKNKQKIRAYQKIKRAERKAESLSDKRRRIEQKYSTDDKVMAAEEV